MTQNNTTDSPSDEAAAYAATVLAEYKAQVLAEALQVARDQGWCSSGVNRTLDRLEIERPTPVIYQVTMRRGSDTWSAQVTALSPEQARQMLQAQIEGGLLKTFSFYDVDDDGYAGNGLYRVFSPVAADDAPEVTITVEPVQSNA